MPFIEYPGGRCEVDDDGYLVSVNDWNEKAANAIAAKEGMKELSREQMDIIVFAREYYRKYNFFPILNAVCKNVHQPKNCIQEKFIDPILAWKLAGLPKPEEPVINLLRYGQTPT